MPPPSLCAVSCSRTVRPREENYVGINAAGSLFLAIVILFWMARVDRCRTNSTLASDAHRLWPGRAHLTGKIHSVPRQKSFREKTITVAKTTKHLHTGHQARSVNMYPSCATLFARGYMVSLHHDDMMFVEISAVHYTVWDAAG